VQVACINTSVWLLIWRVFLNCEAILNIVIGIIIWRSPSLPNVLAFGCCVSTIFVAYWNSKWWALAAELIVFFTGYTMLFYGIFTKLKMS
jgi:hypothetical protein